MFVTVENGGERAVCRVWTWFDPVLGPLDDEVAADAAMQAASPMLAGDWDVLRAAAHARAERFNTDG